VSVVAGQDRRAVSAPGIREALQARRHMRHGLDDRAIPDPDCHAMKIFGHENF
jgi:hypothetical protein